MIKMHYLVSTTWLLFFFWGIVHAQKPDLLKQYQWQNRLLIVYAPSETFSDYKKQLHEFETEKKELAVRDLVTFRVFADKVITPEQDTLSPRVATQLRQKYSISEDGLTVVLIGKDGGEKLTQSGFLSAKQLFSVIDQMPMRRREMKENGSN